MREGFGGERESTLQSGWTVEGRQEQQLPAELPGELDALPSVAESDADAAPVDEQSAPRQMSNLMVVLLGLTGGLYMLYAWIWLSWAQYYAEVNAAAASGSGSIGGVLQQIVFWIAPLAPVLWFLAAFFLLRGKHRALIIALVIGLIVLLPLPMIFAPGAAL